MSSVPARAAALLLLVGAAVVGIRTFSAPALSSGGDFDLSRALADLRTITVEPHPSGTEAHAAVREHLLATLRSAGLETEVQATAFVYPERGNPFPAGEVQNVIGRLPGSGGGDAVLVVGHYDSVPTGPGASDNGAAVAAMLEAARLMAAGPKPKNDLLFLFSDAEEAGLLGARAFAVGHPRMDDVRVVLNFEARGASGPSLMFETGRENGWIVDRYASAVPHPRSSSLFYELYRWLPNDTDFSAFRSAEVTGLNFAYLDGFLRYHTALDDVEHLDPRSLAHHGENLVAMLRDLGDAPLDRTRSEDQVYFGLGPLFVHYPCGWAWPVTGGAVVLFVAVVAVGLRTRRLRVGGLGFGFGLLVVVGLATAVLTAVLHQLIAAFHPAYAGLPQGDVYGGGWTFAAYEVLAFVSWSAVTNRLERRWTLAELAAGGLAGWAVLALGSVVVAPGTSYVPTLPLLCGTAALVELYRAAPRPVVLALVAAPTVLVVAPLVWTLYVALTLQLAAVAVLTTTLVLVATPAIRVVAGTSRRTPAAAAAIAGILWVVGNATAGFDADHPRAAGATYVLDADRGTAVLASSQPPSDGTSLGSGDERSEALRDYFPTWGTVRVADAPPQALPAPDVEVVRDEVVGGRRTIGLRIRSLRQAPLIELQFPYEAGVTGVVLAGTHLDREDLLRQGYGSDRIVFQYWGARPEGFEIGFELPVGGALPLRVGDTTFGRLPRPDGVIPMPLGFGLPDAVLVTASHTY